MPRLTTSYWPADTSSPVLETTIGSVLRDAAERFPHSTALVDGDPDPALRREWTYAEMLRDCERAARALLGHFEPGENVAVWAANSPRWVLLEFAAALAGLTLVTVNPAYQGSELAYVLGHSRAAGLLRDDTYRDNDMAAILAGVRSELPALRSVFSFRDWDTLCASGDPGRRLPAVDPGSSAQILYTSGTTGRPKGAVLTHRGLTNNARLMSRAAGVRPDDVLVDPMPLFHVAGSTMLTLGMVQAGAVHVVMPRFSPALQLELTETYRVTVTGGAPTMLLAMVNHPDLSKRDVSTVRLAFSGGASVPPELVRKVEDAFGCRMVITFAQTESHCSITLTTPGDSAADRAETAGRPLPRTEVKITDLTSGETVAPGLPGEVCTRGYLVMSEYLHAPEATAATVDGGGWLHTGDVGTMDSRGYLRIVGRVKEMIIRGGENIYPREIETVLLGHPGVLDASVVGIPDEYYGEVVGAAIRPRPGTECPTGTELTEFCAGKLAAYKIPVRWLTVEEFPLTASGKIRKHVLSDWITARRAAPA